MRINERELRIINELFKKRVSFKGKITKRRKCSSGMRLSSDGKTCVPITSSERQTQRMAAIKRGRTKKAKGEGAKRRQILKTIIGTRKRKQMGIKDQ